MTGSTFSKFSFLLCFAIALSSCGKDSEDDSAGVQNFVPTKMSVANKDAVAAEGCLSIPLYQQQVNLLDPGLQVLQVSKDIHFKSKNSIRHNYEILTSFGTFQFEESGVAAIKTMQNVTQAGCDTFTVTDADGTPEVYTVKEKSPERISGTSESGKGLTYTWISPTQMEVTTRYISYDLPCGSELKPIFVEHSKVFDWSSQRTANIPADSPLFVKRSYLERIAEATGKNVDDFYSTETNSDGNPVQVLSADRLREIPSLTPRPELMTCDGSAPEEPSPPEDNDGNENGDDNGSGDGSETPPPVDGAEPPPPGDGGFPIRLPIIGVSR